MITSKTFTVSVAGNTLYDLNCVMAGYTAIGFNIQTANNIVSSAIGYNGHLYIKWGQAVTDANVVVFYAKNKS